MKASRLPRPGSIVAATALLLSPGLALGAPFDAAVFVLAGVRIRDGGDWLSSEHRLPDLYAVAACGGRAGGGCRTSFRW